MKRKMLVKELDFLKKPHTNLHLSASNQPITPMTKNDQLSTGDSVIEFSIRTLDKSIKLPKLLIFHLQQDTIKLI